MYKCKNVKIVGFQRSRMGGKVEFTQEGSIVRVTMKNFMTYKHETVYPGSRVDREDARYLKTKTRASRKNY